MLVSPSSLFSVSLWCLCFIVASSDLSSSISEACLNAREGLDRPSLCEHVDDSAGNGSRRMQTEMGGANPKLKMFVHPSWPIWSGLNYKSGFIEGILKVEQIWTDITYFTKDDTPSVLAVNNFASGSSAILTQPIMSLTKDSTPLYYTQRRFVGQFKQSFQSACFPYDDQTVDMELVVEVPSSWYFELYLFCSDGETAKDAQGNDLGKETFNFATNVNSCHLDLDKTASGFVWSSITCTKVSASAITCSMKGVRDYRKLMYNFLLPSVLVSMMSFASFQMDITMAMPRVATTMIAMLAQINMRNALVKQLPSSGDSTWLETYFFFAMTFMFINLFGHVLAMKAHKKGYPILSDCIDDFVCGVFSCLFGIIAVVDLLSRSCNQQEASGEWAWFFLVVFLLVMISLVFKLYVNNRQHGKRWLEFFRNKPNPQQQEMSKLVSADGAASPAASPAASHSRSVDRPSLEEGKAVAHKIGKTTVATE